ncbi:Uncharacterised protein [Mycobacteroides abscessus subsp. massiliense]|nr:Uncharacterised protein [Mycobacteroides abscessus subsp. massiliense]
MGGPGGEPAQPDLGTLQVREHADRAPGLVGCLTHPAIVLLMVGVLAVAEVESRDVHPGFDKLTYKLGGTGRRTKGTNNLSASRHDF